MIANDSGHERLTIGEAKNKLDLVRWWGVPLVILAIYQAGSPPRQYRRPTWRYNNYTVLPGADPACYIIAKMIDESWT